MTLDSLTDLSLADIEAVPIEEIALLLARDPYPGLDCQAYLAHLDRFAEQARLRIDGVLGGPAIARGLSHYLFQEEGFRGNKQDYYNPSNSFLNDVLDQRAGIPLTLSIVYVAVGRRLGLPVSGVSFPGHFLVRYDDREQTFFIDPFNRGKLLNEDDCKKRLNDMTRGSLTYRPEFLYASSNREILIRMLTNLKMIHMLQKDFQAALETLNHILLFSPDGAPELKERGLIYYELECFNLALQDLEAYLMKQPSSPDRPTIETCIDELRDKVTQIQ